MSCRQQSGAFLRLTCPNNANYSCSKCKKEVCSDHFHSLEEQEFCDDCYWEAYLYHQKKKPAYTDDYYSDPYVGYVSDFEDSSMNTEGFNQGFGDGSFSGGGASGQWSEGDQNSLSDNNSDLGGLTDDETFYYS